MKREDFIASLNHTVRQLEHGCGNHGCCIKPPTGMATNMVCQCQPNRISEKLLNLAAEMSQLGHRWEDK